MSFNNRKSLPKAYLHLDWETPNLTPWKGQARSFGVVITDGNLRPFGEAEHTEWIHPDLWDKDTLDFAAKTYGPEFIQRSLDEGLKDWRHIKAHLTDEFSNTCKQFQKVFGPHELWVVCNHTDFDFTILRAMYDSLTRECPIKYNHSLDMQSLLLGYSSHVAQGLGELPADLNTLRAAHDKRQTKEAVAHTALQDAKDQLAWLTAAGVRLPL